MKVSQKRIEANRRNALKSTGPRTPEGKERSRANALKHGFCSEVVRTPEDVEQVRGRARLYFNALNPRNFLQGWLVDEVALLTLKIERVGRIERRERDRIVLRAEKFWDEDRKGEAEALGRLLGRDPAGVVDELERTPHGCEWMMTRWAMLARVADRDGGWDEAQTALAFDLLGTPEAFRKGMPGETIDFDGNVDEAASSPLVVARREVARLRERMAEVADADALDRTLVEADMTDATTPELRRLRRYEGTLQRRLRWCLDQFHREPKHHRPHPQLKPYYDPDPEPEAVPDPAPVAGPDPAPAASDVAADADAGPPPASSPAPGPDEPASPPPYEFQSRVRDFLDRDEARRKAKRRRLERRRA